MISAADAASWWPPQPPVVAAGVALVGVMLTLWQKWSNDRRDAWWQRVEWALDKVTDQGATESVRTIGLVAVRHLQESRLATDTDRRMLDQIADEILRAWRAGP